MLVFTLAIIAGWGSHYAPPFLEPIMNKIFTGHFALKENENLAVSFILLMLGVAVLAALADTHAGVFTLMLGGVLGFFAPRIVIFVRTLMKQNGVDSD